MHDDRFDSWRARRLRRPVDGRLAGRQSTDTSVTAMPSPSLFGEKESGSRRSKLGDSLVGLSKHVDFGALAYEMDTAAPRRRVPRVAVRHIPPS